MAGRKFSIETRDLTRVFRVKRREARGQTREVVIAGDPASASAQPLLWAARSGYRPRQVLLLKSAETAAALGQLAPYTAPLPIEEHQAVAYVCANGACELPTSDPGELTTRLDQ